MARVTVDDCLDHVENAFELVLKAAGRARQIQYQEVEPLVPLDNDKPTVLALREIALGDEFVEALKVQAAEKAAANEEELNYLALPAVKAESIAVTETGDPVEAIEAVEAVEVEAVEVSAEETSAEETTKKAYAATELEGEAALVADLNTDADADEENSQQGEDSFQKEHQAAVEPSAAEESAAAAAADSHDEASAESSEAAADADSHDEASAESSEAAADADSHDEESAESSEEEAATHHDHKKKDEDQ